jgi:hypothetical protein
MPHVSSVSNPHFCLGLCRKYVGNAGLMYLNDTKKSFIMNFIQQLIRNYYKFTGIYFSYITRALYIIGELNVSQYSNISENYINSFMEFTSSSGVFC